MAFAAIAAARVLRRGREVRAPYGLLTPMTEGAIGGSAFPGEHVWAKSKRAGRDAKGRKKKECEERGSIYIRSGGFQVQSPETPDPRPGFYKYRP